MRPKGMKDMPKWKRDRVIELITTQPELETEFIVERLGISLGAIHHVMSRYRKKGGRDE
jgi:hypothetical protein